MAGLSGRRWHSASPRGGPLAARLCAGDLGAPAEEPPNLGSGGERGDYRCGLSGRGAAEPGRAPAPGGPSPV